MHLSPARCSDADALLAASDPDVLAVAAACGR